MTAPMTYFRKRRAIAGGLAITGSSLGGVIFPIMVVHLLPKVGFGWTMRNLRLSHPRPTRHHEFDNLVAFTAHGETVQVEPILGAAAGNQFHSDMPCKLLLVLGNVHTTELHRYLSYS